MAVFQNHHVRSTTCTGRNSGQNDLKFCVNIGNGFTKYVSKNRCISIIILWKNNFFLKLSTFKMSPSLDIEIYFCTIFSLKYIIFKIYEKQKSKEKFFQKSGHFAAVGCHILLITRAQQMTSLKDFQHFDDILVAQNHIICHIWCSAMSQMYSFARSKINWYY